MRNFQQIMKLSGAMTNLFGTGDPIKHAGFLK